MLCLFSCENVVSKGANVMPGKTCKSYMVEAMKNSTCGNVASGRKMARGGESIRQ